MIELLAIPYMGWTSRMAGGGPPKLPWISDQILYGLPYLLLYPLIGWWAIPAYICAVLCKLSGTREYLDMGWDKEPIRKPNKFTFLFSWLKMRPYWHDFTGNVILGVATVSWAFLALALHGHFWQAVSLFLSGAARGLAYMIGWAVRPDYKGKWFNATELAEVLTGAFAGMGLAVVLMM